MKTTYTFVFMMVFFLPQIAFSKGIPEEFKENPYTFNPIITISHFSPLPSEKKNIQYSHSFNIADKSISYPKSSLITNTAELKSSPLFPTTYTALDYVKRLSIDKSPSNSNFSNFKITKEGIIAYELDEKVSTNFQYLFSHNLANTDSKGSFTVQASLVKKAIPSFEGLLLGFKINL